LGIEGHKRFGKARSGNTFNRFTPFQLRDHRANRLAGRIPNCAGLEISPIRPWMSSRSGFETLGNYLTRHIDSKAFDVGGTYIEPENQVALWHRCNAKLRNRVLNAGSED
jgi:hypothetical protein